MINYDSSSFVYCIRYVPISLLSHCFRHFYYNVLIDETFVLFLPSYRYLMVDVFLLHRLFYTFNTLFGNWVEGEKEEISLPPSPLLFQTVVVNYARYKLMIEITLNLHFCFPNAYPQKRTILREGLRSQERICRDFILKGQFV